MKMMSLEKLALLAIPNPSAALHYVPKSHGCHEVTIYPCPGNIKLGDCFTLNWLASF